MLKRISTGISGLDDLMEGGFPENSIIIISGPTGSGKTTAALQFVCRGAISGEKSLYITLEENRENILRLMDQMGLDRGVIDKTLFIVDGGHIRTHMTGREERHVGGILDFNALKRIIELFAENYDIKRLAVDCLTAIGFRYGDPLSFRSDLFGFSEFLRKRKITSVLLTEVEENSDKISRFDVEEFIADGVIKLGFTKIHNIYQRYLLIRKMRFTSHSIRMYAITITDRGILVEGELMD